MDELIISDTSCLIVLHNSNQLELLHALFDEVVITPEVATEFGLPLPIWVRQLSPQDPYRQKLLMPQLDVGEASAISLALEQQPSLLLIDERKGRKIALNLGLKIIGTARVLIMAREKGLIPSLRIALELLVNGGFRLSPRLMEEILEKYGD